MTSTQLSFVINCLSLVLFIIIPVWFIVRFKLRGALLAAVINWLLLYIAVLMRAEIDPRPSMGVFLSTWPFIGLIASLIFSMFVYGMILLINFILHGKSMLRNRASH